MGREIAVRKKKRGSRNAVRKGSGFVSVNAAGVGLH